MIFETVFKAKNEAGRNFDIIYYLGKEENDYYIESRIEGKSDFETVFLGNCGIKKAEKVLKLLAENSVRPLHIEDIISDIRF